MISSASGFLDGEASRVRQALRFACGPGRVRNAAGRPVGSRRSSSRGNSPTNTVPARLALLAALAAGLPPAVDTAVAEEARRLTFDVFLDDRAIGYQRYELRSTPEGTRVEVRAEFAVKFLLVNAFAYDHHNVELWRDGCLQAISSRTNSNGERFTVSGRTRGSSFVVATGDGERTFGECVASFAYWDRSALLPRQRLLNAQTGEYLPVRIDAAGRDHLRLGGRDVEVERYAIRGEGIDIDVAYAAGAGDWVALEGRLDGGRTLRYRRHPPELAAPSAGPRLDAAPAEAGR
jgi:hypothetical protein